ncbi:MAG: hypothetical protein AAFV97_01840 [Bacteroidota bacterium]
MSQFADGGIVASKPYISSANYIHRMSDYCKTCYYDHKKRIGERACPFNVLYWNFLAKHRKMLGNQERMRIMYSMLDKMSDREREAIGSQAAQYLQELSSL